MGSPIGSLISTGIGLATGSNVGGFLAGQAFDAATSGGSSGNAQPNVQYGTGANTYSMGGTPVDTSKYFITGDKGVYNLLPMLNDPYKDLNKKDNNLSGYDTYSAINQKLADDAKAQQAFQQAFNVQTLNPVDTYNNKGGFQKQYNTNGLPNYLKLNNNTFQQNKKNNPEYTPQPFQYVDFGFGRNDQLSQIAKYAAQQNNPFLLAYAPTSSTPVNTGLLPNNTITQPVQEGNMMGAGIEQLINQGATQDATQALTQAPEQMPIQAPFQNFNNTTPSAPYWGTYTSSLNTNPSNPANIVVEQPKYNSRGKLIKTPQKSVDANQSSFDNPSQLPNYSMYIPPEQMPDINAYLQSPNSLLGALQDAGVPMAGAGRFSNLLSTNTSTGK